jgi:FKBP-type peptidyl-prolyl cis-trans isomerase FklB
MKHVMRSIVVLASLLLLACGATGQESPALETAKAKLSYALGMDLGKQLREKKVEVDPAVFGRGLADALSGNTMLLTDEEARALVTALQDEMQRRQFAQIAQRAEQNKKDGEVFLAANKGKEGVVTLESGLQYKVLKAGAGRKPTADDTVTCHYRGTLIDGTEFDSSYSRGDPPAFQVKGVIKGWSEALQLMTVGSKWQLFVPPELAYGSRGAGNRISPNATLVFDVELVAIK